MNKEETKEAEEEIEAIKEIEEPEKVTEKITEKKKPEEITRALEAWKPKTELGRKVKAGEVKDINEILDSGKRILEPEIVDQLLPNLESDLLLIGQAKGKFGGGKRRIFRQTQKKTAEGNKPSFAALAVIGNRNGIVGLGYGKARETVPAREKAIRNAKTNIIKIRRGCGSWQCGCKEPHTIPFAVEGRTGSVRIKLIPAPKGTGLIVESECKKALAIAGIKDVWSKTLGQTRTRLNLLKALFNALEKLNAMKVQHEQGKELGITEGMVEDAGSNKD